jgi:hypothetical protein
MEFLKRIFGSGGSKVDRATAEQERERLEYAALVTAGDALIELIQIETAERLEQEVLILAAAALTDMIELEQATVQVRSTPKPQPVAAVASSVQTQTQTQTQKKKKPVQKTVQKTVVEIAEVKNLGLTDTELQILEFLAGQEQYVPLNLAQLGALKPKSLFEATQMLELVSPARGNSDEHNLILYKILTGAAEAEHKLDVHYKGQLKTQLKEMRAKYKQELDELVKDSALEMVAIQEDSAKEIAKLNASHAEQLATLQAEHELEIVLFKDKATLLQAENVVQNRAETISRNLVSLTSELGKLNTAITSQADFTQEWTKVHQLAEFDPLLRLALETVSEDVQASGVYSATMLANKFTNVEKGLRLRMFEADVSRKQNYTELSFTQRLAAKMFHSLSLRETRLLDPKDTNEEGHVDGFQKLAHADYLINNGQLLDGLEVLTALPEALNGDPLTQKWMQQARNSLSVSEAQKLMDVRVAVWTHAATGQEELSFSN